MKKFELNIRTGFISDYNHDVLDIWYIENKIAAYVKQEKNIYKLEIIAEEDQIISYYCSCSMCGGGMNFCKHLASLQAYVNENEIPELEHPKKKKEKLDLKIELEKIPDNLEKELNKLLDGENIITCYKAKEFSNIISKYCEYITYYIKKKKYTISLNLIIEFLDILNLYHIDSDEAYTDSESEVLSYLQLLIAEYNYREEIINRVKKEYGHVILNKTGTSLLDVLINTVEDKESAQKTIYLISKLQFEEYLDKTDIEEDVLNTLKEKNKEAYDEIVPPEDDMEDYDYLEQMLQNEEI